jgi:hypothetical protein
MKDTRTWWKWTGLAFALTVLLIALSYAWPDADDKALLPTLLWLGQMAAAAITVALLVGASVVTLRRRGGSA